MDIKKSFTLTKIVVSNAKRRSNNLTVETEHLKLNIQAKVAINYTICEREKQHQMLPRQAKPAAEEANPAAVGKLL